MCLRNGLSGLQSASKVPSVCILSIWAGKEEDVLLDCKHGSGAQAAVSNLMRESFIIKLRKQVPDV